MSAVQYPPMLIGLTGHKYAGKDTAAKILAEMIGNNAKIYHFASLLKNELASAFGFDEDRKKILYDPVLKEKPTDAFYLRDAFQSTRRSTSKIYDFVSWLERNFDTRLPVCFMRTPREMMQLWGEWRRSQQHDYFIRHLESMMMLERPTTVELVADVRHLNEAQFITKPGMLHQRNALILVTNNTADAVAQFDLHESEQGLAFSSATHIIHNNGDMAKLRAECARALAEIVNNE